MAGVQLTIDNPEWLHWQTCQWAEYVPDLDRVLCHRGGETYVECNRWHWGEPPRCTWAKIDNSPEACARRKAWHENHKGE